MGYDLGRIGDAVLTHARAFAGHPDFTLIGGVDPDLKQRSAFVRAYAAEASEDLADIVRRLAPEVVVIAAPTAAHDGLMHAVLANGAPRVILCEKPLADDLGEAEGMVRACAIRGCALYVNYLRRSSMGAREVKRRLDAGAIAGPIKGTAWYTKGLLHSGSHFLNLLEYWLGPISGYSILAPGRRWMDQDPEPDVRFQFARGEVSFLAAREENYALYEIDLVAGNGRLRYVQGGAAIVWQPIVSDELGYSVVSEPGEAIPTEAHRTQWHVADQLARALHGESSELCTGGQALETLKWLAHVRSAL